MIIAGHSRPSDRTARAGPAALSILCTAAVIGMLMIAPPPLTDQVAIIDPAPIPLIVPREEPRPIEPPAAPQVVVQDSPAQAAPAPPAPAPVQIDPVIAIDPGPVTAQGDEPSLLQAPGNAKGAGGDGSGPGGDGGGQGSGVTTNTTPTFLNAQWVVQPGWRELYNRYPPEALRLGISGSATLGCQVKRSRRLKNCRVISEQPAGRGFGKAILAASPDFRVYPPKVDGKVSEEAWVAVTINLATGRP